MVKNLLLEERNNYKMPFSYANSEKKNVVLIPVAIPNGSSSKTWPPSKAIHTEYLVLNSRPR